MRSHDIQLLLKDDEESDDFLCNDTPMTSVKYETTYVKRKVCSACNHMIDGPGECHYCQQDLMFTVDDLFNQAPLFHSSESYQLIQESVVVDSLACGETTSQNLGELGESRLTHVSNEDLIINRHTFRINRMKIKEDLIKHFVENKVRVKFFFLV